MATYVPEKLDSNRAVPAQAKSFFPQRDPKNAWEQLRHLSNGSPAPKDAAEAKLALARSNLRAREIRNRHLPDPMFGEPGWDMMLSLYVAAQSGAPYTISSLAAASHAPATTALRWIDFLEKADFVRRIAKPTDKRVVFIELTEAGRAAIDAYLDDLLRHGMATPTLR